MTSEKDATSLSVYRLNVDERDLGKFKSSGIIISTGTGSTGWLYSSRQISANQVNHLKRVMGLKKPDDTQPDLIDYSISKKIS